MQLCFINRIGQTLNQNTMYELYFTTDIDVVWADGFSTIPAGICSLDELIPDKSYIQCTKKIETDLPIILAQHNTCMSFADVTDHILALAYEDISGLEDYPENRLVINYGDSVEVVEEKFKTKSIELT